jgi:toxin-antitoxin system PIN domain toxin
VTGLLDVNALVAISLPNHVHHDVAADWFVEEHATGWATCPVTESGFVRVATNPRLADPPVHQADAVEFLRALRQQGGHEFLADDVAMSTVDEVDHRTIVGHRQVTVVHLLVLARRRGARLVTFDRRLADLVPDVEVEVLSL